jgi:hypothetical protein
MSKKRQLLLFLFALVLTIGIAGAYGYFRAYGYLRAVRARMTQLPRPPSQFRPPSLAGCTRLEIQCRPSVRQYLYLLDDVWSIFDANELAYLDSLKTISVDDPESVKVLRDEVASAKFMGRNESKDDALGRAYALITCFAPSGWLTTVLLRSSYPTALHTEGGLDFTLPSGFLDLFEIAPQVRPFEYRGYCALRLRLVGKGLKELGEEEGRYHSPNQWCDAVARDVRKGVLPWRETLRDDMRCVAVSEDLCTYAMNPDCDPNSPPDTVLLFETKPGWNQHGGPELFTFDHHDPKGGCVVLNDGTVKFVRTKEELAQLRWRP